jgi:hypothetical protein
MMIVNEKCFDCGLLLLFLGICKDMRLYKSYLRRGKTFAILWGD